MKVVKGHKSRFVVDFVYNLFFKEYNLSTT